MSDFHTNGTVDSNGKADNNCDNTSTIIISISVCLLILVMLSTYFSICFCYLHSRSLLSSRSHRPKSITESDTEL